MITMLTGCWDVKEVQSINFVTALGIDYVNGRYIIYAQLVDFSKISKQESSPSKEGADKWVGKSEGSTVSEALNLLYPVSQQQTLWTHVKAIILSKSVIDSHLPDTLNALLRSRDLRYTPWVYGTEQDIKELFSTENTLNLSALNSELMDPEEIYKQYSAIEPQKIIKLLNGVKEPAATVLLPSITIESNRWEEEKKPKSLTKLNGSYVISKGKNWGFVDQKGLNGARYVSYKHMYKYPLRLNIEEGKHVIMHVINTKSTIKIRTMNDKFQANIHVRAKANIVDIDAGSKVSAIEIKQIAEQVIEEQIRSYFESAKAQNLDIYNLEDVLYRKYNNEWKKLKGGKEPAISQMMLGDVAVDLKIIHSSSYKLTNK